MFLAPRFLKRDGGVEDGWSWSIAVSMVVGVRFPSGHSVERLGWVVETGEEI